MHFVTTVAILAAVAVAGNAVTTGDIYRLRSLNHELEQQECITLNGDGLATSEPCDILNSAQRFIPRITTANVFNLFLEQQPWKWVEHIVESSKTVNIKVTPRALASAIQDGVRPVFPAAYNGADAQKWYLVPTSEDGFSGRVTNMVSRYCIERKGTSEALVAEICDHNNRNQEWRFDGN